MSLFELNFKPEDDGITHINIYSKGKTKLGRLLSNFAHTPFTVQSFGTFQSVEGYWYWLSSNDDKLRTLYGYEAKKYGESTDQTYELPEPLFQQFIRDAFKAKLEQTEGLKELLKNSTLPFAHYYVMQGKKKEAGYEWQVEEWERLRNEIKRIN